MDFYKITTDETLRETVQHGSDHYPFAYYPEISGNLTFIALTGTGIMSWNFYMLLKALFSALQEQAK